MTLFDQDAGVRGVLERVFREPALAPFLNRLNVVDANQGSEKLMLGALANDQYSRVHVLHLDPFAFVMSVEDRDIRGTYRALLQQSDDHVGRQALGAASVFFTWGSNSAAALDDLDGVGAGLQGGFKDLLMQVDSSRRIVVSWCWTYYFSMVLVVPSSMRSRLVRSLEESLAPLTHLFSRLDVV